MIVESGGLQNVVKYYSETPWKGYYRNSTLNPGNLLNK